MPVIPVARIARTTVTREISNRVNSRLGPRRCGGRGVAWIALVATLAGIGEAGGRSRASGADAATLARRPTTVRDSQVAPAGGGRCEGHCSDGRCGHGRARSHHADCRHGYCAPHCLVRTESYGYYGTRWRRWPGSGVVPASALEGATPIPTPRSTVPSADEESPDTGAGAAESGPGEATNEAAEGTNDAADAVRLPAAPGIDDLPAVGEPPVPPAANDTSRPTGWRRLLVDGAVMPTLFARPAPTGSPGRAAEADARRPAARSGQPAEAPAGRGR